MPDALEEARSFRDALGLGVLKLRYCARCDAPLHPKRVRCSDCGGPLTWIRASGAGEVFTASEVCDPSDDVSLSLYAGIVRLEEGVLLLGTILGSRGRLRRGCAVAYLPAREIAGAAAVTFAVLDASPSHPTGKEWRAGRVP